MRRIIGSIVAALALQALAGSAQDMFPVRFRAICRALDPATGQVVITRLTGSNIIAQAIGPTASTTGPASTEGFSLVYNPTADSLQVVDTNGTAVADVIHFRGGASITNGRHTDRFTFMFLPGQTNEFGVDTNLFGSAVITQRAPQSQSQAEGQSNGQAESQGNGERVFGRLQFVLRGGEMLGITNSASAAATNGAAGLPTGTATNEPAASSLGSASAINDPTAQICEGTFVGFLPVATNAAPSGTTTQSPGAAGTIPPAAPGMGGNLGPGSVTNSNAGTTTGPAAGAGGNAEPGTSSSSNTMGGTIGSPPSNAASGTATNPAPAPSTNSAPLPPLPGGG